MSVDWGLNFAIVQLPMYSAVIPAAPVENVSVYFDDQGWIVAYLPKGTPAAAIWKYKSVADATGNQELENNLLVLAINEVLRAHDRDAEGISHAEVAYYDWENEDLDAFALFSASAVGGESHPIKFVIPRTITDVQASAAVVISEQIEQGGADSASIAVDGKTSARANERETALRPRSFN